MFASATDMRSLVLEKSTQDDIKEIGAGFCLCDVVIALDTNDAKGVMTNTENTIV